MSNQLSKRSQPLFFRFFSRQREATNGNNGRGFVTKDEFERQLSVERSRVERSGYALSMIIFTFQGVRTDEEIVKAENALMAALLDRTRVCDTKGWYAAHPAVILPYTTLNNATNLIGAVESLYQQYFAEASGNGAKAPRLLHTIHGYPEGLANANGPAARGVDAHGQPNGQNKE